MGNILWIIVVVLVILWLAGLMLEFGGALIHAAIVVAVIVLIFQVVTGRRRI